MYKDANGKWQFVFCPKSWGLEEYCPFCSAVAILYKGNASDRKTASNYRKKSKHAGNFYVIKDPRDNEAESEEDKNEGKVLLYEFPDKVETKVKKAMNDKEFGAGLSMFDPSPDGSDFLIDVGATKPIQEEGPNKGKIFPDYSDSKFVKTGKPLGTDKQIEEIMSKRHDLTEYMKSMERTKESLIELVKTEMLYDLIEHEVDGGESKSRLQEEIKNKFENTPMDDVPWVTEEKEAEQPEVSEKQEEITDDELLAELNNL
jgi:hypothetical protein